MYGFKSHSRLTFQDKHFEPSGPAFRYPRVEKAREKTTVKRQGWQSESRLPGVASQGFTAHFAGGRGDTKAFSHDPIWDTERSTGSGAGRLRRPESAGHLGAVSKPMAAISLSLGKRKKNQRDTYIITDPLEQRPSTFFAGRRQGNLPNVRPSMLRGAGSDLRQKDKRFSSFLELGAEKGPSSTTRRASCGIYHEAERSEEAVEHRPNDKLHCAMRAHEMDKEFYQQQLLQWRAEINPEELAEELNKHRAGQFFDFMQADRPLEEFPEDAMDMEESGSVADSQASLHPHNGAGLELQEGAEKFLPGCFLDSDLSVDGEIPPHPSFSMAIGVDLAGNQSNTLRDLIAGFVATSKPSPQLDSEHVFRPTWCRFVLDCFVLRAPSDVSGWPSLHYAVRHFDSVSHPWKNDLHPVSEDHIGPKVGSTMCVHIEQCLVLVSVLLGGIDDPVEGTRFFFEAIVPQVLKLHQCIEEDNEERTEKIRETEEPEEELKEEDFEEKQKQRDRARNEWLNQRKPTFIGNVKQWYAGLANWRKMVEKANSQFEKQKHMRRSFAFRGFLEDMLVEPDTFHFVEMFRGLFKILYQTYADMRGLNRIDCHGNPCDYHMRFTAFFRFCLDFGLFSLCSYEEIKRIYLGAECQLELQPPPQKTSNIPPETTAPDSPSPKPKAKAGLLRAKTMPTRDLASSPKQSSTLGYGKHPTIATQSAQLPLARSMTGPTPGRKTVGKGKQTIVEEAPAIRRLSARPALDTSWIEKPFHKMTEAEAKAYHTLAAMHGYIRDRFQRVEDFFAILKTEIEGLVSEKEFLKGLQEMHLEHDLELSDIHQIMQVIDQDNVGYIDVSDLDKACGRINKDALLRVSEEEREQRKLQSVQDSLFTKVNRHLQDPGLHQSIDAVTTVFNEACFIECILKIVMLYLNSSACSVQSVAPTYMKCLWLISFLHFSFQGHVDRYEDLNRARPWSQSSTRPTTSQESTRPATRETNRPATVSTDMSEGSVPSSRRTSKQKNLEPVVFVVSDDLTKKREPGQRVSYTSPLEQLMSESPDLFVDWPHRPKHPHHGTCSLCGRRPWNGWGSGMCHGCSIVDQISIHDGLLYPIIERSRIIRKYKDIKLLGVTAEQAATATRSHSASDYSASSNAGSENGSAR
eukprot:gnl/MRDRNA2_/MRDRNA2_35168_c0_seq1.p1 gnl/MRDRNA2_/MRDRNA2_35168_c0~~gnl/MRDRNA2_/MRDRNA2_35168_c0_seq1.p1  ORF type:complete len:1141 (-),score=194.43 gnl/MRDRNA2_/MRDRNA2_35168_c0_seq1:7-3429(-)